MRLFLESRHRFAVFELKFVLSAERKRKQAGIKNLLVHPAGGFATSKAYETTFNIYCDGLRDFILLSEMDGHQLNNYCWLKCFQAVES
jgi:hypothetical protein